MTTRKATAAELFHNLTLAFRQLPPYEYENAYPVKTLALIETPFWKLTPEQKEKRLAMIERGLAEGTVENRHVRLMAMRTEHRYLLTPAYVRLATVNLYSDMLPGLPDEPGAEIIAQVMWEAIYRLFTASDVLQVPWSDAPESQHLRCIEYVRNLLTGTAITKYGDPAARALSFGIMMTFSDTPDVFYQQLVA